MSSTCYTKQNNKEREWIAWTQNGRGIRWGVFASGWDMDRLVYSRATSTRGSIPSLRFTMRSRMSWRIVLHSPSG